LNRGSTLRSCNRVAGGRICGSCCKMCRAAPVIVSVHAVNHPRGAGSSRAPSSRHPRGSSSSNGRAAGLDVRNARPAEISPINRKVAVPRDPNIRQVRGRAPLADGGQRFRRAISAFKRQYCSFWFRFDTHHSGLRPRWIPTLTSPGADFQSARDYRNLGIHLALHPTLHPRQRPALAAWLRIVRQRSPSVELVSKGS